MTPPINRKDRRAALKATGKAGGVDAALALAMTCCNTGDMAGAERAFRAVLRLRPDFAECHANLGAVLQAQGKVAEALLAFTQAARLKPDYPEAHYNQGAALLALGRAAEAEAPLRRALALRMEFPEAQCNLGQSLADQGRYDDALAAYDHAIALRPDFAPAHNNRGVALTKLRRHDDALAAYGRAIDFSPAYAEAHLNLGNALLDLGRPAEAVQSCVRAVDLAPNLTDACNSVGIAWRDLGQVDQAEAAFRRAIALDKSLGKAWANLADVLALDGRFAEAVEAGTRAVKLIPKDAFAQSNLGVALEGMGQSAAALIAYDRAVALDPDHVRAQVNRAMALLRRGRFAEGWAEFEWRWKLPEFKEPEFKEMGGIPRWNGEDLNGRSILVTTEQGFGDAIHFIRFAAAVAARGGRVILRVARPLMRLLHGVAGVAQVVALDKALPQVDVQVPLLSLPYVLGLTDIPHQDPYIQAEPSKVWPSKLHNGRSVGLVWAGATHSALYAPVDRRRSLTLAQLAPVLAAPNIHWVSLQKDVPAPDGMENAMVGVGDFAETAGIIAGLDLVISVDTAVAHLAAAMGKPVWLLSRFDSCWRWMNDREDSPWYPTLRLFRQDRPGEWEPVLARVAAAL